VHEQYVQTPVGKARLDWFEAEGTHRATIVLGHGTATGVEAADLQALARALPSAGITVALMTQPYRIEHNPRAASEAALDQAWRAIWPEVVVRSHSTPVIAGGRSAGSEVACRTAASLGAAAVLVLAYPLLGPGSPRELLSVRLPALVVQGGLDPFGHPAQFPALPDTMRLVEIPGTNHMFSPAGPSRSESSLTLITEAVAAWLDVLLVGGAAESIQQIG
jgi:predicted alpha/beta-hydrolase family hydrolase